VFLDRRNRIRFVTPAIAKLIDITASDKGRPIGAFAMRFEDPSLLHDAERVLETLLPSEAEVVIGTCAGSCPTGRGTTGSTAS
jgi:hypothetical protein